VILQPRYSITNSTLSNIAKAAAAKEIIENAPLVPALEVKFRQEALVKTVHHSTHLEGNPLDLASAKEILDGRDIEADIHNIQEIINLRNVLKFIEQKITSSDTKITIGDLLTIHHLTVYRILPAKFAGEFRTAPAVVKDKAGRLIYTAPKPHEVPNLVEAFLTWLNSPTAVKIHPLIRAAVAHYEIVRIHPFSDGNGRTARAVSTLVLFLSGFDVKEFFSLDEYFDLDPGRYYAALKKVSDKPQLAGKSANLTPWIEYFTQAVAVELNKVKERVLKLSRDARLKRKLGQLALSERQARLMEYIQDYGKIASGEWRRLFPEYSDDTILRDLKELISKKVVRKKGKTKAAVYLLA